VIVAVFPGVFPVLVAGLPVRVLAGRGCWPPVAWRGWFSAGARHAGRAVAGLSRWLAVGLSGWCQLFGLCGCGGLEDAGRDTLRCRLWGSARWRVLEFSRAWPWTGAFLVCWARLCAGPVPAWPATMSLRPGRGGSRRGGSRCLRRAYQAAPPPAGKQPAWHHGRKPVQRDQ